MTFFAFFADSIINQFLAKHYYLCFSTLVTFLVKHHTVQDLHKDHLNSKISLASECKTDKKS